jgi:hypothetical protein
MKRRVGPDVLLGELKCVRQLLLFINLLFSSQHLLEPDSKAVNPSKLNQENRRLCDLVISDLFADACDSDCVLPFTAQMLQNAAISGEPHNIFRRVA